MQNIQDKTLTESEIKKQKYSEYQRQYRATHKKKSKSITKRTKRNSPKSKESMTEQNEPIRMRNILQH